MMLGKIFILVLFSLLLVIPTQSYGSDNNFLYGTQGLGKFSCGKYAQSKKDTSLRLDYYNWMGGYITAYNIIKSETFQIMGDIDLDGLMVWLDNFCQTNPLKSFAVAVEKLMGELYPKRQKEAP